MGIGDRLRRPEKDAEREMIEIPQKDGTVKRPPERPPPSGATAAPSWPP